MGDAMQNSSRFFGFNMAEVWGRSVALPRHLVEENRHPAAPTESSPNAPNFPAASPSTTKLS